MIKLIDLLENKMTPDKKKKKEKFVKGMKKAKGDFKKRYGKDAEAVMYATATKRAMKEELDPVGEEDEDINNDGKVNKTDKYLKNRRKAIAANLEEGDDHEVAMAQNSLKAIAEAAMELSNKIGDIERNIPGWIQDHITNAENYIEQAAQGFHELSEGKAIASNYQLTDKQFQILKDFGVKVSTSGNELYFPETLYIDLDKNKKDSKFKQAFYDTVPTSDQYLASQVITGMKKSISPGSNVKIGDKKYFILKGHMTKNGNFNFDNPYRSKK